MNRRTEEIFHKTERREFSNRKRLSIKTRKNSFLLEEQLNVTYKRHSFVENYIEV